LRSKSAIDTSSCGVLKSPSNRYFYDSSGTYFDTIPNSKGCDSIMQIRVTINNTRNSIDTSYCGFYLSPSGKLHISQTGVYDDTIPNTKGCDSIITIRFTKTNLRDTISISDCKSYQSPSGKYVFSLSGQYTDTLQSVFKCDSILFINYVRLSPQSIITKTICDTLLSPSGKYVYSASGTYQDTVPSYLGCDSVITINLIVNPIQLTVSKSNDISCDSLFSTLQATTGYSYVWSPQNSLNDVTISNPRASPSTNTIYYVIVSDSLGCTKMDSVEVLVNKDEIIEQFSNVFTPNDDGINDCLMLKGIGELKQVDLVIYNRWGTKVFSTNKPNDCWDGRIDYQEAPAGTYFFVLKGVSICETLINQHGSVQLIR
jgi:gliding motility-associated-like protein